MVITNDSRAQQRTYSTQVHGFTLIELIILLAVVSILFRFGVPAFQDIKMNTHMTTQINAMVASFNLARSEAIKRHHTVVLCPDNDGRCARQPHWHNGWLVFIDKDQNREIDDGEEIIYTESSKQDLEITSSRYRRRVVFRHLGSSAGSNASFIFCDQRGSAKARAIILSNSGRTRVALKRSDGKTWKCS